MPCGSNNECNIKIEHTICWTNKKCICDFGYHAIGDTICAPMINRKCSYNELCATKNSLCIDNECRCKPHYTLRAEKCIQSK